MRLILIQDVIKVRGWQVAPFEIEACLLTHPAIEDAAVVGVQLPGCVEVPRAYVVINQSTGGIKDIEEEIIQYVRDRLAKYKAITGGCRIVGRIPKNPTGKILRGVLKERARLEVLEDSKLKRGLVV